MNFKPYIVTIGFIFICLLGFADNYTPVNIGAKGELQDNYIHCIYKDSDGFIWLGTGTTIERWDGIQSVPYPFPEYNLEYTPYLVNAILEREPHDYWVGCKKGLWRLNPDRQKMEQIFAGQVNFPVYALAKDKENNLYIGTTNGLYTYDGDTIRHIRMDSQNKSSGSEYILGIEVVEDGNVWLITPEGLVLCEPQTETVKFYPNTLSGCGSLLSLAKANEKFYIGTEKGGIITFDLSRNEYSLYWDRIKFPVSALSHENELLAIATLGQGIQLLSLTDKRLVYEGIYDPGTNSRLTSNRFSSILLSDGDIWCGTDYYSGMLNLKKEKEIFKLYSENGFKSSGISVRGVLLSHNQVFISNRDGFVCIKKNSNEVRYFNTRNTDKEKLRSDLIFSFYEYEGNLLIGTYAGGLSIMNPETYTFIETPLTKTLSKNDIFMFLEDEDNNLWIATSDGLYFYNKRTKAIKEYNAFNSGMPGNIVYGIYIDSSGRFWVATNRGLTLFDRKTATCSQELLPEEHFVKNEPVRSIYEGRDSTLFFCLLNKEKTLFVLDKELKNFQYPLPVECYNILQDYHGYYWLGSHLGVIRMNEDLSHFTLLTTVDGLPDAPMAAGASIVEDENNKLWICNMKGVVIANPDIAIHSSPLKITEIFVNGKKFLGNNETSLLLEENENNIVFQFASLGYENPEKLKYEFMLEGLDSVWSRLDNENKVAYYKLTPGVYTFKVRKLLNEDSATEISFKIKRDFPGMSFYYSLFFLGTVILIIFFIWNRKKQTTGNISEVTAVLSEDNKEEDPVISEKYAKLPEDAAGKMIKELKAYMEKDKPYLNVDLKQSDVAAALGYSTYLLSAVFTHYLKVGYYDFVNTYRVEEFKSRVKAEDHKKYTLLTLAEQCGFKSKTSFFRFFKKATGLTPKEYIQQVS